MNRKVNIQNQDPESDKWQISKRKFNVMMQNNKDDKRQRAVMAAQIDKRDKDEIQMKAQIEQIVKKKDNRIKELENEVSLLKNRKIDNFNTIEIDDNNDYLKYKEEEYNRIANEPNRYNGWIGTLIKYE